MFSREQDLPGSIGGPPLAHLGDPDPAVRPAGGGHDWGPDGTAVECARCGRHVLDVTGPCRPGEAPCP